MNQPDMTRGTRMVLLALALATVVKLAWLWTTLGSNDIAFFRSYALRIKAYGLADTYRTVELFNHTPLTAGWSVLCEKISDGNPRRFSRMFRLPGVIADICVVLALLRLRRRRVFGDAMPWWALALFAASPVSAMVTGFHGNVDPLLAAALAFSALACAEKKTVRSALWLALACNIKVAALLAAPTLGAWWLARGRGVKFTAWAAGATVAGWVWPLAVCPREFLAHVLGYGGFWGIWGVPWWLRATGDARFAGVVFTDFTPAQSLVMAALKCGVLGTACVLGWLRRKMDAPALFRTLAFSWLVFLIFAPSVAGQYLVWPAVFLLVWSPRWYAITTAAFTVFLAVFYTILCGGWPWDFGVSDYRTAERWLPWSNLAWFAAVAAGVAAVLRRERSADGLPEPHTEQAERD